MRSFSAALLAIGVFGLVPAATGAHLAGSSRHGNRAEGSAGQQAWRIMRSSGTDSFGAIEALSDHDVWVAVDHRVERASGRPNFFPLLEHWDGARWQRLSVPIGVTKQGELWDLAAVSTDDVWVVGATSPKSDKHGADTSLLAHWDGAVWKTFPKPAPPAAYSRLTTITAIAADDIWVIGTMSAQPLESTNPRRLFAEHWDGTRWSLQPLPLRGSSVDATGSDSASHDDVWIVGSGTVGGKDFPLTAHWNGRRWAIVQDASIQRCRPRGLNGVVDIDKQNAWAVGYLWTGKGCSTKTSPPVEHWNGTRWRVDPRVAKTNPTAGFFAVDGSSVNDVWAVGPGAGPALVQHWNGSRWAIVYPPDQVSVLYNVDVPAKGDVWATGQSATSPNEFVTWKPGG